MLPILLGVGIVAALLMSEGDDDAESKPKKTDEEKKQERLANLQKAQAAKKAKAEGKGKDDAAEEK